MTNVFYSTFINVFYSSWNVFYIYALHVTSLLSRCPFVDCTLADDCAADIDRFPGRLTQLSEGLITCRTWSSSFGCLPLSPTLHWLRSVAIQRALQQAVQQVVRSVVVLMTYAASAVHALKATRSLHPCVLVVACVVCVSCFCCVPACFVGCLQSRLDSVCSQCILQH